MCGAVQAPRQAHVTARKHVDGAGAGPGWGARGHWDPARERAARRRAKSRQAGSLRRRAKGRQAWAAGVKTRQAAPCGHTKTAPPGARALAQPD